VKWITSAEVNPYEKEVQSSMLFGLLTQTAKYLGPYRGCSLKGKAEIGAEPLRIRKHLEDESAQWPIGISVDLSRDGDQQELAISLDVAVENYKQGNWTTRELVVVQDGKIVYEYYAPGFSAQTPLLGWSMSKTLMASLIGVRINEGALELKSPVHRWFPEWRSDNRSHITIDDLLTMQSGLQWLEGYTIGNGEVIPMLFNDDSCSERPRKAQPAFPAGTRFSYASGTSNLLSEILRASIKYDEAYWTYPARMLFDPIGATSLLLETDRLGTFNAAAFSYGTARDWARIGLLFLNDGVWVDGKRILPEGWVEYATTPRPSSHGIYGAHFWLGGAEVSVKDLEYDVHLQDHAKSSVQLKKGVFTMTGFGGQFVSVIPEKKAVIVRLAHDPSRRHYGELISKILEVLP
jgi:CubicO group peptidase (beta-lactamase class C family)